MKHGELQFDTVLLVKIERSIKETKRLQVDIWIFWRLQI